MNNKKLIEAFCNALEIEESIVVDELKYQSIEQWDSISSNEFIYPMQTLLFVIRDDWNYRFGSTYLFLPLQVVIPRAIYPKKPKGLGSELVMRSTSGGQGYAYTPTTEAFLNFGYIGPFIVFFFFGIILSRLVKSVSKNQKFLSYILFYSLIFDFMRGEFSSFLYQLLVMGFIIQIIQLLQSKIDTNEITS